MSHIRLDSLEDVSSPFHDDISDNELPDEPIPSMETRSSCFPRSRFSSWQASKPSTIILLVSIVKFLIVTSGMLLLMPVYRLIEDAFCHRHYQDDSPGLIEEMKCKVDEVQSPLAFLMGWLGLLSSIMNLIVSYPYGILADRIGRKPTALFSYSSLAFSFATSPLMLGEFKYTLRENPNILLYGCVFTIVGGGFPVLVATLFAMAADVSTEKDKASSFLYLSIGASAGGLLGPLIAGLLMHRFGPWAPISIVLGTIPCVYAVFFFIPETLTVDIKTQQTKHETVMQAFRNHISHGIKDLRNSLNMLKNPNIPLCLVAFFFNNARFSANSGTLAQYVSKYFHWTLAETSVLLSPLGIVHLLVLASLPKVSEVLMSPKFGYSAIGKDLMLARVSFLILTASALIRAVSSSIAPFLIGLFIGTFGAAEGAVVRAAITYFVEPSYTSRLFALIGMAEVLGTVAGGPMLAYCFDLGLRLGGAWTGLPWFYLGLACFLPWLALHFVRPRKIYDVNDVFGESEEGEPTVRNPVQLD